LEGAIQRLANSELIEWAHWIKHKAEADDTNKDHIHLVIQPNKAIDTLQFFKEFIEPDPNNELPLKCLPPNKTKNVGDWILYGLHHIGYLASKFETREYTYSIDDMQSTDRDLLLEQYRQALRELNPELEAVKHSYDKGLSLDDILLGGYVNKTNLNMIVAYYSACQNKKMKEQSKAKEIAQRKEIAESIELLNRKLQDQCECAATATRRAGLFDCDNQFNDDEAPPF
jgi:hypothetical protein